MPRVVWDMVRPGVRAKKSMPSMPINWAFPRMVNGVAGGKAKDHTNPDSSKPSHSPTFFRVQFTGAV